MLFALNPEQQQLQDSLLGFFERASPVEAARKILDDQDRSNAYDRGLWMRMSGELGLLALSVPEEFGGVGAGLVELAVVFEQMGRQLVSAPYFSTAALASRALLNCGDSAAMSRWLPGITAGDTVATLALAEDSGSWDLDKVTLVADQQAGGWALSGHKAFVTDGDVADLLLVVARAGEGVSLLAVDASAVGLTRTIVPTLDGTRKLARLTFTQTPAQLIGTSAAAGPGLQRALREAAICLAAEEVGGAQRCLDMAVGYAKDRVAFGRPIGTFQAIKHKCADLFLAVESARSAVYYAAWAASVDAGDLPLAAAAAKAYASEAYVRAAQQNIQIHGGIGFTWEHDAHLYLKRARSSSILLGPPEFHLDQIADRMGLREARQSGNDRSGVSAT